MHESPGRAGKHELYRVRCSDAKAQDSWSPKVQIFHMISAQPSSLELLGCEAAPELLKISEGGNVEARKGKMCRNPENKPVLFVSVYRNVQLLLNPLLSKPQTLPGNFTLALFSALTSVHW